MINRIREKARFTKASGMAVWCRDQMGVRYTQAVSINEGLANEEIKRNEVIDDGDYDIYVCDLPLSDLAYAEDAYNTLSAASVWAYAQNFDDGSSSWIEHHQCGHNEIPQKPCTVVNKKTT
jgi:hypothetical protein